MSAPYLLRFGSEGVLKIFPQRITQLINLLMNDEGVCRTAPATPGLLNIQTILLLFLEQSLATLVLLII